MDLLAHLEAYVATADETSFSRAADRLGIAQPLLSRRVKTLEEHFGGLLFDRSRRQITTTELGVLLLPYARDVLDRAQRLRQAAGADGRTRTRTVGVPAHCAPAALARAIRAAAEHGITLGMCELPPLDRDSGLADGSLAYALVRVPAERGAYRVPLGLASAAEPEAADGQRALVLAGARRAVRFEDLRPRRGRGAGSAAVLPVLTLPEDQVPAHEDRLERAAARAGLPPARFRPAGSAAGALAETLAGRALLLCAEPFARQHGARWAPLGDRSLHRGYDVRAAPDRTGSAEVPHWLVPLLASAVGAARGPAAARSGTGAEDAAARLAARG
ncbi:LysR family transcriptional regulator [Streptomyces alanosinicus]|uniref:Transcriptional regulator n=1 Tax=Streptomyces alanosinicus TaxID=68171 RepID=A0A918YLE3_9ACTN|nr:LysR family transcriptional regulator [Streptomyces alanosinicus]GHE06284.1 transcriptional regulator [Streptomyces alanosinicus]